MLKLINTVWKKFDSFMSGLVDMIPMWLQIFLFIIMVIGGIYSAATVPNNPDIQFFFFGMKVVAVAAAVDVVLVLMLVLRRIVKNRNIKH